jgi:hypothetical protein
LVVGSVIGTLKKAVVRSDLNILLFAQGQTQSLEETLNQLGGLDERLPLLIQLPGISLIAGLSILAAIGDISRFPSSKKLVSYAGLGSRVHESGADHPSWQNYQVRTAQFTLYPGRSHTNRRQHPPALAERVEAPWTSPGAQQSHRRHCPQAPHRSLVALANQVADRFSEPERIAHKLLKHAYRLGQANRTPDQSTGAYVRVQLDRLKIGKNLQKPEQGAHLNRSMSHTQTGVRRTLFPKAGTREKRWLIQNMACYFLMEQGDSHDPGAINRAKNQRNLAFEIWIRLI